MERGAVSAQQKNLDRAHRFLEKTDQGKVQGGEQSIGREELWPCATRQTCINHAKRWGSDSRKEGGNHQEKKSLHELIGTATPGDNGLAVETKLNKSANPNWGGRGKTVAAA